jgi:hypothetical protein
MLIFIDGVFALLKYTFPIALAAFASTGNAEVFTFPQVGFEIPTSGPANPSIIYVEGVTGVVKNISVKLNAVTHGYASETMFAVSNPNGWATLIWDSPQCKFNNSTIKFSDLAAQTFEAGCRSGLVLANGEYKSANNVGVRRFTIPIAPITPLYKTLNELILPDVNGRWILWGEDFVSGDGGNLGGWELIIETEDPPEGEDEEASSEGSDELYDLER